MAIKKQISTALYSPLVASYRYNNNIVEVYLPKCALNCEVFFADEGAFNSFCESVSYFIDKGLIFFDKVSNTKAIEKTANESVKKDNDKINSQVNKSIENIQSGMGFKNASVKTQLET